MFRKTLETLPGEPLFLLHWLSLLPPSEGAAEQGGLLEQGKEEITRNRRLHEYTSFHTIYCILELD